MDHLRRPFGRYKKIFPTIFGLIFFPHHCLVARVGSSSLPTHHVRGDGGDGRRQDLACIHVSASISMSGKDISKACMYLSMS